MGIGDELLACRQNEQNLYDLTVELQKENADLKKRIFRLDANAFWLYMNLGRNVGAAEADKVYAEVKRNADLSKPLED